MHRYITHIAILLLLLFCRVMVPDALLVSLHAHAHTEHAAPIDPAQDQLGEKHNHCPVENLFGAPYQGKMNAVELIAVAHVTEITIHAAADRQWVNTSVNRLRGPPVT